MKIQNPNVRMFECLNKEIIHCSDFRKLGFSVFLILMIHLSFVISATWAESGSLADPMRIGVGARSMGMGKAYVGLAEDGDALFLNPAGIARNPNLKISSMYSKLLNDTDYTVLGGVYPISERSALGIGYIGNRTGDIILRSATGTQEGTASWGSNVLSVSYGTYLPFRYPRDVLIGGNLKYFSTGTSGDRNDTDSGIDLDLGLLLPLTSYLNLGLNAQNVLPTTMSQSGDDIPLNYKVGTKIALVGKKDQAILAHHDRKLNLLVDADLEKSTTVYHYGLELWPTRNLALRLGSDANDLTAGVGVRFFGIEFNYAYHPYTNIPENTTHYFSLSYLGEVSPRALRVKLEQPQDKTVIHEDFVRVAGQVEISTGEEEEETGPVTLNINNTRVSLDENLAFAAEVPVENYGKNLLLVEAADNTGMRDSEEVRILRLTSFADVPEGYWAKKPIENSTTVGLLRGYPDGTFRPEEGLTRAEMAALLIRAKGVEPQAPATGKVYKDVPANFWASRYIEEAKRLGIMKGYIKTTREKIKVGRKIKYVSKKELVFLPQQKVKMVEAITILARFDKLALPEVVATRPFADVSTRHWAVKYITAAKSAGMLSYLGRGRLGVEEPVSRSEIVEMLSQTSVAETLIKDLHSWEKGFRRELYFRPKIKAEEPLPSEALAVQ